VTQAASDGQTGSGADADADNQEEKRSRLDEVTTQSTDVDAQPESESKPVAAAVTFQKASPPPRCNQCRQLLDDSDLRLFPGDHCDAVSLSVFFKFVVALLVR